MSTSVFCLSVCMFSGLFFEDSDWVADDLKNKDDLKNEDDL